LSRPRAGSKTIAGSPSVSPSTGEPAPSTSQKAVPAIEYKHPWTSANGKFAINFSGPPTKREERVDSIDGYEFHATKYAFEGFPQEFIWEYTFPQKLTTEKARKKFLDYTKESHASALRARRYFHRSTADGQFAGNPSWQADFDNRLFGDIQAHARKQLVFVGDSAFLIYSSPHEITPGREILNEQFFQSMRLIEP
jgi:hypothetical protein